MCALLLLSRSFVMIVPYERDQLSASSVIIRDPVLHGFAQRLSLLTAIVCRCVDHSLALASGLLSAMKVCWIALNDSAQAASRAQLHERNILADETSSSPYSESMLNQLLENFASDVVKTALEEFAAVHVDSVAPSTSGRRWAPTLPSDDEAGDRALSSPHTLGWYMDFSCWVECSTELSNLFSCYEVTGIVRDELNNTPPESGIFTLAVSPRTTLLQCRHGFPCFGCAALIFSRISARPTAGVIGKNDEMEDAVDDPRLWTIFPRHCSNHSGSHHHSFRTNRLIPHKISSVSQLCSSRAEPLSFTQTIQGNPDEELDPTAKDAPQEESTFQEVRLRLLFWLGNGSRQRSFFDFSEDFRGDDDDQSTRDDDLLCVTVPVYCLYTWIADMEVRLQHSRLARQILQNSVVQILPLPAGEDRRTATDSTSCILRERVCEGVTNKIIHRVLHHSRPVRAVLTNALRGSLRGSALLTADAGGRRFSIQPSILPHFWTLHTRFTLLFDLDRTLVDNSITSDDYATTTALSYAHANGFIVTETIFLRKGVRELLHQLASIWQLRCILATKSSRNRALAIIQNLLDPTNHIFCNRLFCMEDLQTFDSPIAVGASKSAVAVLRKFHLDVDVDDVLVVDDAPQAWVPEDWTRVVAVHPYALSHRDPPNYFYPDGEVGQQILYRLVRLGEVSREHPSPLTPIFPTASSGTKVYVEEGNHFDDSPTCSSWSAGAEEVVLQ